VHGEEDKIIPVEVNNILIKGSKLMLKNSISKDKEIKIYPSKNLNNLKNYIMKVNFNIIEVLNEPERDMVMDDIIEWLNKRVKV
jgi:hypothetical protein